MITIVKSMNPQAGTRPSAMSDLDSSSPNVSKPNRRARPKLPAARRAHAPDAHLRNLNMGQIVKKTDRQSGKGPLISSKTVRHNAADKLRPLAYHQLVGRRSLLSVRTAFLALALGALVPRAEAGDFARSSEFESVEAFVTAATAFQPSATKSDLSALFTVREFGQPEDPKTGTLVAATSIQSSVALWSSVSHALVFVTAAPPTQGTRSAVGVLFFLSRTKSSWRIIDSQRFTATGKDAGVSAELTSGTGTGYHLGSDGMKPVVTVRESHGGRGYSYQSSASYTLIASKLKRLELK